MRYFCVKCGAESEEQLGFCLACGTLCGYAPMVYLRHRVPSPLRYKTAKRLAYGKVPYRTVWGLGRIPVNESIFGMVYGDPGSGKSTFMLRVADSLSGDRSVFMSAEEGFGETLSLKLRRMEIFRDDLFIVELCDCVSLLNFMQESDIKWCFLDSFSVLPSWNLLDLTKIRESGLNCILSLHITKDGRFVGQQSLAHQSDMIIRMENMNWFFEKNRFGELLKGSMEDVKDECASYK